MEGKSLVLQIKDFKFPAVAQNTDDDVQGEIIIPYPELAEYLNRAEECPDETIDEIISSQSDPNLTGPGVIRRRREHTQPEELESKDEQFYRRGESVQGRKEG